VTIASVEHNSRAVYSALLRTFDGNRGMLREALQYWFDHFGSSGAFRATQFIDGLMQHVGLTDVQRRSLSIALYSALGQPTQALPPLPDSLRPGAAAPAVAVAIGSTQRAIETTSAAPKPVPLVESPERPAHMTIFLACLQQLVADVQRKPGATQELTEVLQDVLEDADVPNNIRSSLEAWTRADFATSAWHGDYPPALLRRALNTFYVALCEVLGPVATDRALSRAIAAAEQLPESTAFMPKQLL
jgi:hypothetical protein